MNQLLEKLYFQSPVFVQNIMTTMYGYKLYYERYLGKHDKYLQELLESQWYSDDEIEKLTNQKLQAILKYATKYVPYYKKLQQNGDFDTAQIKHVSDLTKLPILKKEDIREQPDKYISTKFKKSELIAINTSGTTGKTLKIYVDKNSRRYSYAFYTRLKNWAGISGNDKNITFAGRTIVPPDSSTPPFWRSNPAWHNYLFSSYHLSTENIKFYIDKITEINPVFIDSYPSSIYTLAKYMKEYQINKIKPKAIITSSETLLDSQREIIEEVFNCSVFDQYGCAEQVVFVSQCEKGSYHINPEYGIVEFIREDGSLAKCGEEARLICTGFTNYAMPLIRYDIGDTGILSNKKCACGRNFPVIEKIVGRTDDILIMRDGRQVGRLDPVFKGLQTIKEAQIVQEDFDNVILNVVPGKLFQISDAETVVHELKKRLGTNINVHINVVSRIKRTSSGKFRAVISKVRKEK